ncbi:hypothetical protein Tco_1567190, partial [Tanacetum coccineum]
MLNQDSVVSVAESVDVGSGSGECGGRRICFEPSSGGGRDML